MNRLTEKRIDELKHIRAHSSHVICGREIADICAALDELQQWREAAKKPIATAVIVDDRIVALRDMELPPGWRNYSSKAKTCPVFVAPPTITFTPPPKKHCPAEYEGSLLRQESEVWNSAIDACANSIRSACQKVGIQCVIEGE